MVAFSSGCGSLAVDPSDRPALSESRQQAPAPPESPVLANLRSAEWAQAHGLPVNPHRGNGPSITFYGPNGTIRRHIAVSEASLRPPPRETRAGFALLPASLTEGSGRPAAAGSARLIRQGVLTDSVVTIGSTEQLWVFEDGVLITKSIFVAEADSLVGGSHVTLDAQGAVQSEVWVPASGMGSLDPEDPQYEIWSPNSSSPLWANPEILLASCVMEAQLSECQAALLELTTAAVILAPLAYFCVKYRIFCDAARIRAGILVIRAHQAWVACSEEEWETQFRPDGRLGTLEVLARRRIGVSTDA